MKYIKFGRLLAAGRRSAGIAQQAELALVLGVKQQTISRWEQGASRPRPAQIPALAAAIGVAPGELSAAAGYSPTSPPQIVLDNPWPIDALPPESFERFCTDLVTCLSGPEADVHSYGSRGHKQEGLDLEAVFRDGKQITYQCKRRKSFGPKKVAEAVAAHSRSAVKKVLLLSSLASPQAREEIKKHAGWELWDREDITRKVRLKLQKIEQRALVDTYFPGQSLSLLGELEPSPWRTPDVFFAGMMKSSKGFWHGWKLQGRQDELSKLDEFSSAAASSALLLIGNGGSGKSRLLKAFVDGLELRRATQRIYFLSRDALTSVSLSKLGTGAKLLICDDAHDRTDLGLLTEYVANPENDARLVLSLRKYGLLQVTQQARGLDLSQWPTIELKKLTVTESESLASQALEHFGGDPKYATRISSYTRDCPLATVIAAEIVSNDGVLPEFLVDEESFRKQLLSQLVKTTVRGVSSGLPESAVATILGAISLLQPISDDDPPIIEALAKIAGLHTNDVIRILKRLREGGILFHRGSGSRISPDLLGDFVIEDECVTETGKSTGFAESVFDNAPDAYAENILLNLGRLDWRKSNGKTRNSLLLNDLWARLRWHNAFANPHFRAAAAVAFYQPHQALVFVRRMLREGRHGEELSRIVRNAAYDPEFLPEACQLLWSMGRNDPGQLGQNPMHGVRVLADLAAPKPGRLIASIDVVVDFALSLIPIEENWLGNYSPIDILIGALATEGHTTSSTSRAMTLTPYIINPSDVDEIRKKVIHALIELLHHDDSSRAYRAAGALDSALRAPFGLLGATAQQQVIERWNAEFASTLAGINEALDRSEVAPVILIKLGEAVSWHAQFAPGVLGELAQKVLDRLDGDIRSKTVRMLTDGWGNVTRKKGQNAWTEQQEELNRFADQLVSKFQNPALLHDYITDRLAEISAAGPGASPQLLINRIIDSSAEFARELLARSSNAPNSVLAAYSGAALAKVLKEFPDEAAEFITRALEVGDTLRMTAVAEAYARFTPGAYSEFDARALEQIVTSSDDWVLQCGANALRQVAEQNIELAIDLVTKANLGKTPQIAHNYLMWLCHAETIPYERLSKQDLQKIVSRLVVLQSIDDYWVQEFIKKIVAVDASLAIGLLVARIKRAAELGDYSYQPMPWSSQQQGSYGLLKTADARQWLQALFDWALESEVSGESVDEWFGDLIKMLCAPFNDEFLEFVESWALSGGRNTLSIALNVLREVPRTFVFDRTDFVLRFLRHAQAFDQEMLDRAISAFYASAVSGMRSGVPGEPFPEDIRLRDRSKEVMARLARFEPGYDLYHDLLKHAEQDIERQYRQGKQMDEEDSQDE